MIRLIIEVALFGLGAYMFLKIVGGLVDTIQRDFDTPLSEGCVYDGDCPMCEKQIIRYTNKTETEVSYFCKHCGWQVNYMKIDGKWRKLDGYYVKRG